MEKTLDLIARVPDNQEFKEQLLKAAYTGRHGTLSLKP